MGARYRLTRWFPVICWGRVSFQDGYRLAFKTYRSGTLFTAAWIAARFVWYFLSRPESLAELFPGFSQIKEFEHPTGFIGYLPRDARKRQYGIIYMGEPHYFMKFGQDIPEETLAPEYTNALRAAGFDPCLPLFRVDTGFPEEVANIYPYLPPVIYQKTRLTAEEAAAFSSALNSHQQPIVASLRTQLAHDAIDLDARRILSVPSAQDVISTLDVRPLAVGVIHGDLMSPNILRSSTNGRIVVLDWESAQSSGPLLVDKVGAQDWAEVVTRGEKAWSQLSSGNRVEDVELAQLEALTFLLLGAARGHRGSLAFVADRFT